MQYQQKVQEKKKESLNHSQINYRHSSSPFPVSPVDLTVSFTFLQWRQTWETPQRFFFFFTPVTAISGPTGLTSTSRRGCSRKAASKDRPAGLLVGRPESRTGSDPGCLVRWRTGRAPNLLRSWWAFQAALGRGRLKRAEWRLGWGRPRWKLTEAWVEKKERARF